MESGSLEAGVGWGWDQRRGSRLELVLEVAGGGEGVGDRSIGLDSQIKCVSEVGVLPL